MSAKKFSSAWNTYGQPSTGGHKEPEFEGTQRPIPQQSSKNRDVVFAESTEQNRVVTKLQASYASYFTEMDKSSSSSSQRLITPSVPYSYTDISVKEEPNMCTQQQQQQHHHVMTPPLSYPYTDISVKEEPQICKQQQQQHCGGHNKHSFETTNRDTEPFLLTERIMTDRNIPEQDLTGSSIQLTHTDLKQKTAALFVEKAEHSSTNLRMDTPPVAIRRTSNVEGNGDLNSTHIHKMTDNNTIELPEMYPDNSNTIANDYSTVNAYMEADLKREIGNGNNIETLHSKSMTLNSSTRNEIKAFLSEKLKERKFTKHCLQGDVVQKEALDGDIVEGTDDIGVTSPVIYSPTDKQFECDICKVSFGFRSNLIRHRKTTKHIQNDMKLTYLSEMSVDSTISADDDTNNAMAALSKIDKFIQKQALTTGNDEDVSARLDDSEGANNDQSDTSEQCSTQSTTALRDITKTSGYMDIIDSISDDESARPPQTKPADLVVFERNIEHLTKSVNAISDSANKPDEAAVRDPKTPVESRTCNACHKVFPAERFLITHLRRKHAVYIPLTCTVCGKTFSNKGDLRKHVRIHSKDNPYACELCGRAFKQKIHLKSHYRCHNEDREFECSFCHATFKHKNNMTMHLRIHTGERPFACSICDKTFTHNTNLKVHLRLHSGQKKYNCEICLREFTQKHHLKRHRNIHVNGVNEQQFRCETCFKIYTQRHHYRRHLRRHMAEGAELTHEQIAVISETTAGMDESDLIDEEIMDLNCTNDSIEQSVGETSSIETDGERLSRAPYAAIAETIKTEGIMEDSDLMDEDGMDVEFGNDSVEQSFGDMSSFGTDGLKVRPAHMTDTPVIIERGEDSSDSDDTIELSL